MKSLRRLLPILLATVLFLTGCGELKAHDLPLPGKQVDPDDAYQVTAEFADVLDVVPRTLVLANDVPVGQVDEVERKGWHATVKMSIREDVEIPADAQASIRRTSLLGEKYIALVGSEEAKSAGRLLADGAHIPIERTGRNPEVEEVLGTLSFLLARGGVGQLRTISTELNNMLDGREDQMKSLLSHLDTTVASLDQHKGSIIEAMEQVDRLTATINREKGAVANAIESFGPALRVLHRQHQDLTRMLDALDELGVVATRVIDRSGAELTEVVKSLRPTLRKLADAGDSLPRGLMMLASFPFPEQAQTLARGHYSNALFYLDLDLNKVVQGLTTGGATGLPQLLQLCATYTADPNTGANSCEQVEPLAQALCDLSGAEIFCSMIGRQIVESGGITTTDPSVGGRTQAQRKRDPIGQLAGGLLSGLAGEPADETDQSGGLAGLLGQLLGGNR